LPAICRTAAARSGTAIYPTHPMRRFCCRCSADRQQAALLRPSARIKSTKSPAPVSAEAVRVRFPRAASAKGRTRGLPAICLCPQGVGAWLADDLPRSGSKIRHRGIPDTPHAQALLPVPGRSSASCTPTAFGQNQKHKVPRARFCRRPYACLTRKLPPPKAVRVRCQQSVSARRA